MPSVKDELFLLNMNDYRNFSCYGSIYKMENEQAIHKRYYARRIHPHSRFRVMWETFYIGYMVISVVYFYVFLVISHYVSQINIISISFELVLADIPLVCNIFLNLVTGFFVNGQPEAVMDFPAILIHCLKTTLVPDLLGLVLGTTLWNLLNSNNDEVKILQNKSTFFIILHTIRSLGIFCRTFTPNYYWRCKVSEYFMVDGLILNIIQILILFPVIISCMASSLYIIAFSIENSYFLTFNILELINNYFHVILEIWTCSDISNATMSPAYIVINVFINLYPYLNDMILVAIILIVFWSNRASSKSYDELVDNLNEYLQSVRLSERLKIRIVKFYQEAYGSGFYSESYLMDGVSSQIKDEVVMLKVAKLREEIAVLKMVPANELLLICTHLVYEVFFGNDVIAYSDTLADRMYFIAKGSVAIYTNQATEVFHLPVSSAFLWRGVSENFLPNVANFVACETTILYSISREDYKFLKQKCPVFVEHMTFAADVILPLIEFLKEKDAEDLK